MLRAALLGLFAAACASAGPDGPAPGETGGLCGGIAGIACEAGGDYCAMAAGVCQPRPQMCTREYRPVCGCDGETYGNACTAAAAGVSIAYDGMCR